MNTRTNPIQLISWLLAATLLLALVGLTAEPLPPAEIVASQLRS